MSDSPLDASRDAVVVFVRSRMAHARLLRVDVSAARGAPGVLAAVMIDDVRLTDIAVGAPLPAELVRPLLARDVVRFVGEPIAAVVAATDAEARSAAELVAVEYGVLPVIGSVIRGATDEVLVHDRLDTNTVLSVVNEGSDSGADEAPVPGSMDFSATLQSPRTQSVPTEPRSVRAAWRDDGGVNVTTRCASPNFWAARIADVYGLPEHRVSITVPPSSIGGEPANEPGPHRAPAVGMPLPSAIPIEAFLLPRLAQLARRPVVWREAPDETAVAPQHRGATVSTSVTVVSEGRLLQVTTHLLQDVGAYPSTGAAQPYHAALSFSGPYGIPTGSFAGVDVVTHLPPIEASPAGGSAEATIALERAVDLAARGRGLAPVEVRRHNLVEAHGPTGPDLLDRAAVLEADASEGRTDATSARGGTTSVGWACPPDVDSSLNRTDVLPGAAYAVEVRVPRDGGAVNIGRVIAVHRADPSLDPDDARDAVRSGIAIGTAMVLVDGVRYDAFGQLIDGPDPSAGSDRANTGPDAVAVIDAVADTVIDTVIDFVPASSRQLTADVPADSATRSALDRIRDIAIAGIAAALVNAIAAAVSPDLATIDLPFRPEPTVSGSENAP